MAGKDFEYDVFLSHSCKDEKTVRKLAKRLTKDGVRVWLDVWEIKPGDPISMKIQHGVEVSRTLVMCMSPDYFESEWGRLEHHSMLFRDPTNAQRRFLPLLIKDCHPPAAIAQYVHLDWRVPSDEAYERLLDACQVHKLKGDDHPDSGVTSGDASPTRYVNAKVVLIGESGVGKSGLAVRLCEDRWQETESTHSMNVWPLKLPDLETEGVEREVWLWDFAGQPDYRLIHQLYMDGTALGVLVFDPQDDNPFESVGYWDKVLDAATEHAPAKLLVAGRCDRGGITISRKRVEDFVQHHGFSDFLTTSAKLGEGCEELKTAITKHIPWERLPWIATSRLFKSLKDAILKYTGQDAPLARLSEFRQRIQLLLPKETIDDAELRSAVGLMQGQGAVQMLGFGDFVLLQPEWINRYASVVVRMAREHADEMGVVPEQQVLDGRLDYKDMHRLNEADVKILLRAIVQMLLDRSLCIREQTTKATMLVFPSYFRRDKPDQPEHPSVFVTYEFSGPLDEIYATLVVRLSYSGVFEKAELWKDAADFKTPKGKRVGLAMHKKLEGAAKIVVYFEAETPDDTKVTFIKYVHEHLLAKAQPPESVTRVRTYICPSCGSPLENVRAIQKRLDRGLTDIVCAMCDERVTLFDVIEEKFASDEFLRRVREMDEQARINLDNESMELVLVGHSMAVAGEAGQICRTISQPDWGIDAEIEFKDSKGEASGKRVYLQFKSGDSYLYQRQHDDMEVFSIRKRRQAEYWGSQAFPVMLVIRSSDGRIRWMNITEYLQRHGIDTKQIVFEGEAFTAASIMRIRHRLLGEADAVSGHGKADDSSPAPKHKTPTTSAFDEFSMLEAPLRVRQLVLDNIRGIDSLELNLSTGSDDNGHPDPTIILAENGTGKTTILRALALLLAGQDQCLDLFGDPDSWLRNGTNVGSMRVTLESSTGSLYDIAVDLARGKAAFDSVAESDGLRGLDTIVRTNALGCFVAGYGVNRRLPGTGDSTKSEFSRSLALKSLFSPDVTLNSLTEWALDLHYERGNSFLKLLKSVFERIVPDMPFARPDKKRRVLLFRTVDGEVPLSELSDAYQIVIGMCGDLLFRITHELSDFDEPLKVPGILLLDEIDLHLHPVWQLNVLNSIRNLLPNFQIITTTHSPLVIAALRKRNIQILQRDEEGVVRLVSPELDPQGMGFAGLLKSESFGLRTTVDRETQKRIDRRNALFAKGSQRSQEETNEMTQLTEDLSGLGFAMDFKDPYYTKFVQRMSEHTRFHKTKLTAAEQNEQNAIADEIISEILGEEESE